jgi:hypothetical protein
MCALDRQLHNEAHSFNLMVKVQWLELALLHLVWRDPIILRYFAAVLYRLNLLWRDTFNIHYFTEVIPRVAGGRFRARTVFFVKFLLKRGSVATSFRGGGNSRLGTVETRRARFSECQGSRENFAGDLGGWRLVHVEPAIAVQENHLQGHWNAATAGYGGLLGGSHGLISSMCRANR